MPPDHQKVTEGVRKSRSRLKDRVNLRGKTHIKHPLGYPPRIILALLRCHLRKWRKCQEVQKVQKVSFNEESVINVENGRVGRGLLATLTVVDQKVTTLRVDAAGHP